jgi:pilus assembly protein Flp/PilA
MTQLIRKMWSDDEGQDLIEYALMLTLILLVSVAAIQGIGTKVSQIFTNVNNSLSST